MAEGEGFGATVGVERVEGKDGRSTVVLDAGPAHLNRHGSVHGGAIATLADSAMGLAVAATPPGEEPAAPVTIEMKVTYLQPAGEGRLTATGVVRKRGKRITVVEAEIEQDGDVVALALGTFTAG
jgi:uncharacterized protein (TIGR00369 family)